MPLLSANIDKLKNHNFFMKISIALKITLSCFLIAGSISAQTRTNKKDSKYQFTVEKEIGNTEVKNQGNTGTCWSFSALSFLESEVERMGKGKVNLSEMYIVRRAYALKSEKFVRMMGKTNFGQGGAFHDVINVMRTEGLMPDEAYSGFAYGQTKFNHSELEAILIGMVNTLVTLSEGKLSSAWRFAIEGILDAYLGKMPAKIESGKKSMSPQEYQASLGLNADDYVEISSFTHHPFYSQFVLEVPDNWAWNMVFNLPLDEMEQVVDNALKNGYTVAWAADVSEPGFSNKSALAIVPEKDGDQLTKDDKENMFQNPVTQKTITQEIRQKSFDNLSTQDDHGMHIVGIAKDQNGTKYYIVKNSWGEDANECGGYFYCSASYLRYKTTCIMVHKGAIPAGLAAKLKV